jgi:hypothetical protein
MIQLHALKRNFFRYYFFLLSYLKKVKGCADYLKVSKEKSLLSGCGTKKIYLFLPL